MGSTTTIGRLTLLLLLLLTGGCASAPENTGQVPSYALADTGDTMLGKMAQRRLAKHPDQSGFVLLTTGIDAFVARAMLARAAQRSLDVQYYMFHDDLTGNLFLYELLQAAERGVRVRMLIDDMDLEGMDRDLVALDSMPNVELRLFNPFDRSRSRASQYMSRPGSISRRMHNKSFTVDGQATVIGGRNIGDEYFEAHPDMAFADLDAMAIGPVVNEVSEAFDIYWNSAQAYPVGALIEEPASAEEVAALRKAFAEFIEAQADSDYAKALHGSTLSEQIRTNSVRYYWGSARVMYDRPEKVAHERGEADLIMATQLKPVLESTQSEMLVISPYFVPTRQGVELLSEFVARGVRVRILTNSLSSTDVGIVHSGYSKYRHALLRNGIELYELDKQLTRRQRKDKKGAEGSKKAALHAKSFILDRRKVFIGSRNMDPRSVYENTEIGVVLTADEMGQELAARFDDNIAKVAFRLELETDADGFERILWHAPQGDDKGVYIVDPHTGFWRRFGLEFMSIFPIDAWL